MKNLVRLSLPKISEPSKQKMMSAVAKFIRDWTQPIKIIFIGSILSEKFDECSDIDVIVIYNSQLQATESRKLLYSKTRPELGHSLEIMCVDQQTFDSKSKVGGIYAIALNEGLSFSF